MNNNRIQPTTWVMPNNKEFIEWVNKTFLKYRLTGNEKIGLNTETETETETKRFKPFKIQKMLRDYMGSGSPYRGILLYHTVGGGKTCTSIGIAENLKRERNIVVMLPASLRSNFINQGILYCGDDEYKVVNNLYKKKYSFISYNANNTLDQLRKLGTLDNKVIIIEEVHNLTSIIMGGLYGISKQGKELYDQLISAKNAKIIALSGTPLVNDPLELAILYNILKGYIEITYFRIISAGDRYGNKWDFKEIEAQISELDVVDYMEINKVNKSIEFHLKIKHYDDGYFDIIREITDLFYNQDIIVKYLERKDFTLFPLENDGDNFYNYFVDVSSKNGNKLKNSDIFKKRILGLTSYYEPPQSSLPDLIVNDYIRVPMSSYQYALYTILRNREKKTEKGNGGEKRKKGRGSQVKSVFRVFSREACNFVFPEDIVRPYKDPKFIVTIKKLNNNNKGTNIIKTLEAEEKSNNEGKMTKEYKMRIDNALSRLIENGDTYLRPGADGLDKLSPKMNILLENINKSKGKVFVYSNFRVLEGVEIFSKILDFNGYAKYGTNNNLPKYVIYSGMEDETYKTEALKIYNGIDNLRGERLKILLATSAGAEGLDLKCVRQIHIMEPYWNQMRIKQVIGRGQRTNSHKDLPMGERNVEVFKYLSVLDEKNAKVSKENLSTDEYINQLSYKKQVIIDDMLLAIKQASFDCVLNSGGIKNSYGCFTFGSNAKGLAYMPKLDSDIISAGFTKETKKVKKNLLKGVYYNKKIYLFNDKKEFYNYTNKNQKIINIDIKKAKPVMIDSETNIIYDYKSIGTGTPIKIAIIKDGKIKKL